MEVVAERGLVRTTLRDVADAAGVSVGLVQRYFASKDELLAFGFEYVYQRTQDRVRSVPLVPPVKGIVVGIGEAVLPLDPERRRESRVWLAFVQATLNDARLAETHRRAAAELVTGLRDALEGAQRLGELDGAIDAEAAALGLTAFLDGLTVNGTATEHLYPDHVLRALLRSQVDRLFERGSR